MFRLYCAETYPSDIRWLPFGEDLISHTAPTECLPLNSFELTIFLWEADSGG